jgi:hypothetical protein
MSPAVLIAHVHCIAIVSIGIMKPFITVTKIILPQVVRRVNIDHVYLARVSTLKRGQRLKAVTFDHHVLTVFADRELLYGLKKARSRNALSI